MPFGRITMTHAFHSSSFGGKYMGMPTGLVIRMGDTTIYNTGDTGIFGDMALIAEIHRPDVLILPIGDRFTMGPADATRAAEMVNAPIAIPVPLRHLAAHRQRIRIAIHAPNGVEVRRLDVGASTEV